MEVPHEASHHSPALRSQVIQNDGVVRWTHRSVDGPYSSRRGSRGSHSVMVGRESHGSPLPGAPAVSHREPYSVIAAQGNPNGYGSSSEVVVLRRPEISRGIEETKDWLEGMKHVIEKDRIGSRPLARQRDPPPPTDFHHPPPMEEELPCLRYPGRSPLSHTDDLPKPSEPDRTTKSAPIHQERGPTTSNGHHYHSNQVLARAPARMPSPASSSATHHSMEASKHSIPWEEVESVVEVAAPLRLNSAKFMSPKSISTSGSQRQTTADYSPRVHSVIDLSLLNDPVFSFYSFMDGHTFNTTAALCKYNIGLAEALSDEDLDRIREVVFKHNESDFAELLYGDDIQYELDLINATLHNINDLQIRCDMHALSIKAVKRFNRKCCQAQKVIRSAGRELPKAIQSAASRIGDRYQDENAIPLY
ncbi:unnamed protein product [Phytomonas sp. Hart1]|nr:unnamed protein product [Phytomonas sp. Hart1]|eukprot:CCW66895.1 unnamed protein product [Phytomonas sp. isolate Hart1]